MDKMLLLKRIAAGEKLTSFENTIDGYAIYLQYVSLEKEGLITFQKLPVKLGIGGLKDIRLTAAGIDFLKDK